MFTGYSSLGAVALHLIKSNNLGCLKRETKHSLDQAIEQVIWRKKTIAASGCGTSYVWWWFYLDGGELAIEYDSGKLSQVSTDAKRYRYVPLLDDNFESERLVSEWIYNDYYSHNNSISKLETAMLKAGLQPYQKCLSAYTENWSRDYYGESDCSIECELLYVEPVPYRVAYLPVFFPELNTPEMKGLYVR